MKSFEIINICLIVFGVLLIFMLQYFQWRFFVLDIFEFSPKAKRFVKCWISLQVPVFGSLIMSASLLINFLVPLSYWFGGVFVAIQIAKKEVE